MVSLRSTTLTVGSWVSQCPDMIRIALGGAGTNPLSCHDFRKCLAGIDSSIERVGDPWEMKNVSIAFLSLKAVCIQLKAIEMDLARNLKSLISRDWKGSRGFGLSLESFDFNEKMRELIRRDVGWAVGESQFFSIYKAQSCPFWRQIVGHRNRPFCFSYFDIFFYQKKNYFDILLEECMAFVREPNQPRPTHSMYKLRFTLFYF